jgi:hypothetical protein
MRVGSKEHRKYLLDALRVIRAYEKSKGSESYFKWIRNEMRINRFIKSQSKAFARVFITAQIQELRERTLRLEAKSELLAEHTVHERSCPKSEDYKRDCNCGLDKALLEGI